MHLKRPSTRAELCEETPHVASHTPEGLRFASWTPPSAGRERATLSECVLGHMMWPAVSAQGPGLCNPEELDALGARARRERGGHGCVGGEGGEFLSL